jgi:hypothetical protein
MNNATLSTIAEVISRYQTVNHGWDGDQYFQGCGTSYTGYANVVTGRGDSEADAITDAIDQLSSSHSVETASLDALLAALARDFPVNNKTWDEIEGETPHDEWAYRFSIRFSFLSDDLARLAYEGGELTLKSS